MNSQQEQYLRSVNVANARDHRLVQQHSSDWRSTAANSLPQFFGTCIFAERILSQPTLDRAELFVIDQFAARRPVQVKGTFLTNHT